MEVFAMTQSNQQSAHAAADRTHSGQTLLGVSRRTASKNLGMAAGALLLPVGFSSTAFATRLQAKSPAKNPKWYGFSLLEYFSTDPDWMKYFPYKNDGMFQEGDFRWIRDWGFNWVRLPRDYRFWTDSQDLLKIREDKVAPRQKYFLDAGQSRVQSDVRAVTADVVVNLPLHIGKFSPYALAGGGGLILQKRAYHRAQ
jgi:hypothetical protein